MNRNKYKFNLKKNVTVSVLCALALITTIVIRIPVAFLTLDLKDTVITLTALFFGPLSGLISAVIVPTLELILIGDTGVYGFIMNVLASVSFCLPVGLIYKYKRTLKGAVIGLVTSVFSMTAIMVLANLLITPHYTGMDIKGVAELIPVMLLPFNFVKAVLNSALVLFLYKPLSRALKKTRLVEPTQADVTVSGENNYKKSAFIMMIAAVIVVISLVVIFAVLGGRISWFDAIKR